MGDYPQDAEGMVLSQLESHGLDMSQPHEAVFDGIVSPCTESQVEEIKSHLLDSGYGIGEVHYNSDQQAALFECKKELVLTHQAVLGEKIALTQCLSQFGGMCDGFVVGIPENLVPKPQPKKSFLQKIFGR